MKKILLSFICAISSLLIVQGQTDPVLFTVEGNPVKLSEFEYIYSKNNGKELDYSAASLEEYLDLYVKFKLKVQKAKDLQMDTIPALKKELEGYRQQLAKSYLTDKEVTERLIQEVFERQKEDIEIQHILIKVPEGGNEKQVSEALKKATKIYQQIENGLDFDTAINKFSEDKFSSKKDGKLGYMTAMFPSGFYELESVAYTLKPDEISKPLRTKLGFHIVKVLNRRPARGEMEVAHILVRKKSQRKVVKNAKSEIDSIYQELLNGAEFGELARTKSQDASSAKEGGYIGFFGINRFEKPFEDAAFGLKNDGDYSEPVESSVGWHIIKRISVKPRPNYETAKKSLKSNILKDPRYQIATESLVERIKEEASFVENSDLLDKMANELDISFFSYKWEVPTYSQDLLFSFGDNKYSINDFALYAKNNARDRLRMEDMAIKDAVYKLYNNFVDDKAIKYEESQLENKYPDFKSLMREYEEGILLFEVTKNNVWDKAGKDSVGLENFYQSRKDNYMWKERATVDEYTIKSTDAQLIAKIAKKAKKKSPEWLKQKYGDIFEIKSAVYERGSKELAGFKFAKNAVSIPRIDDKKGLTTMRKIISIAPVAQKTLSEARGYIEADYQDKLEREWVADLKQEYDIEIYNDVLKTIER